MNRIKLRENTFKLLFCNEFHNREDMPEQYQLFLNNMDDVSEEDKEFITGRVNAVISMKEEIDKAIGEVVVGWTTDRMSNVDLAILRLAYYEMKIDEDIPQKVAVDQAVELAKKYSSEDSPAFINGILAKLF